MAIGARAALAATAIVIAALLPAGTAASAATTAPAASPAAQSAAATTYGWTLQLHGVLNRDLTCRQFASLAAKYKTTWNDGAQTWAGVPLWRMVQLIDDRSASTFNKALAKKGYAVQVIGLAGAVTLKSTDRLWVGKNNVLIADQAGSPPSPLPFGALDGATWTPAWPTRLVGPGLTTDQELGGVVRIVVYGPGVKPPVDPARRPGWIVQVRGGLTSVDDSAAQFRALAKAHPVGWTDAATSTTYSGTALWRLVAQADGGSATTLNLDLLGLGYLAHPGVGYSVDVVGMGAPGVATTTFTASQFAGSNSVILADRRALHPPSSRRSRARSRGPTRPTLGRRRGRCVCAAPV